MSLSSDGVCESTTSPNWTQGCDDGTGDFKGDITVLDSITRYDDSAVKMEPVQRAVKVEPDCIVSSTAADVEKGPKVKKAKLLPPCRICGEKASGLHYGVNTCEACKGFFRRSLSRGDNFQCAETGDCEIIPGRRNNCAACRYQKCLTEGMSKNAIKIGRYTHEKRTQDIREVRNIQPNKRPSLTQEFKPDISQIEVLEPSDSPSTSSDCTSLLAVCRANKRAHDHLHSIEQRNLPSVQEQKVAFSMSLVDEMQKYVQRLSEALVHMKYFFAAKPPECLNHLVQNRLNESKLETELLGEEVMPNKEYVKVMAETGLDLDQRRELIQHWAEGIEETFIVVAQFAKCTPGFKSLSLDDQITLIKATRSQLLFTASHKRFDTKHRCFIGRFNRVESYQDIVKIYNNKLFVDMMIDLAGKFMKIRLTDIEWLLVLTLIMTHPSEEIYSQLSPSARKQLKIMHNQQLRILEFYLKLNHPDDPELAIRIHQTCEEMRVADMYHARLVSQLCKIWEKYYCFPPLFEEIILANFDGKRRIFPRMSPKIPAASTTQETGDTATPSTSRHSVRHWKKSKIAQILESSECINKLMSAAVARSRDHNVLPPSEMRQGDHASSEMDPGGHAPPQNNPQQHHQSHGKDQNMGVHSADTNQGSLSSKLNTCYGVSFGDRLSPVVDNTEPLSKSLVLASDWQFNFLDDISGSSPSDLQSPTIEPGINPIYSNTQHSPQELMTSLPSGLTSPLDMTSSHNLMMQTQQSNTMMMGANSQHNLPTTQNLMMTTQNMMMSSAASQGLMSFPDMLSQDLITSSVHLHQQNPRLLPAGAFLNPYHRPIFTPPTLPSTGEPIRSPLTAPTRGKDDSFFLKSEND